MGLTGLTGQCDNIGIKFYVAVNLYSDVFCQGRKTMNFSNAEIGMLLLYTAGGLALVLMVLLYIASKKR